MKAQGRLRPRSVPHQAMTATWQVPCREQKSEQRQRGAPRKRAPEFAAVAVRGVKVGGVEVGGAEVGGVAMGDVSDSGAPKHNTRVHAWTAHRRHENCTPVTDNDVQKHSSEARQKYRPHGSAVAAVAESAPQGPCRGGAAERAGTAREIIMWWTKHGREVSIQCATKRRPKSPKSTHSTPQKRALQAPPPNRPREGGGRGSSGRGGGEIGPPGPVEGGGGGAGGRHPPDHFTAG